MQKSQRVVVQKETITAFSTYKYFHSPTNKVNELDAKSIEAEIAKAKFYENGSKLPREIVSEKQEKPVIKVVNSDCIIEALELKKNGFRPLVLNMACATNVGGGYKSGAGAQEENLFRRTNLFQYHEPNKKDWYPIPEIGGIYCPNATVIRSSEQDQYEFLEVPEMMSFVAVAAMRRPKLIKNYTGEFTLAPQAKILTRRKIQAILNIGLVNGHDAIVLSAFGCGAYRNPPSIMAELFYEVISTEYAGGGENLPRTYRHISFAIIDDHNSNKEHNPEGNFLPFKNKFAIGLDNLPINNISDAMDSISHTSQESLGKNSHNNNNDNNSKGNYEYRRNNDQNRQPYNERRGRGRGKGGFRREVSSQTHGHGRQMTLDAVWKYKPSQDHIDQLMKMGYSGNISKKALYITEGNMEEAANWLMQNAKYKPSQDHIDQLTGMGYSERMSKKALYTTEGNMEEAVNWLLQNAVPDKLINDSDTVWKYKPSQDHVDQLMEMGYSERNSKKALYTTEGNMEEAINWLMQNAVSDKMIIDTVWKYKPSQDHINQLMEMGYSERNSKKALYTTEGNMEEAVKWLMQNAISDKMISLGLNTNTNVSRDI